MFCSLSFLYELLLILNTADSSSMTVLSVPPAKAGGSAEPDAVIAVECRSVGDDYFISFFQAIDDLNRAHGIAPERNFRAHGLGAIGCQDKHSDRLVGRAKGAPATLQDVFETLEFYRTFNPQIRTGAGGSGPINEASTSNVPSRAAGS